MVGTRKPEPPVVETEDNAELLAKEELNRFRRQLRLMENDKRSYLKESNGALFYQKGLLQTLELEHRKIKAEVEILNEKVSEEKDKDKTIRITESSYKLQKLEAEFLRERSLVLKLRKLKDVSERVEELQTDLRRIEKEESSIVEIKHRIHIAKRKLETVTGKFDGIVAENSESRRSLDESLHQNMGIMEKCMELEKEIEKGAIEIRDLTDQATATYDQREEAVNKMMGLLDKTAKEKKQNFMEMSELSRTNRHEQKLLDFMNIKNRERLFLETNEDRLVRLGLAKEKFVDQAIESYRENFEKLVKDSSRTLLDLVEEYGDLYHKNIQSFSYINELNKDVEILQKDAVELREQIRNCSLEIVEQNQTKKKIILSHQNALDVLMIKSKEVRSSLKTLETSMEEILGWTVNLFKMIESSDKAHVLRLLGKNQEISPENLILYVNILEQRLREMFQRVNSENHLMGPEYGPPSRSRSPRPSSKTGSRLSQKLHMDLISVSDKLSTAFGGESEKELDPLAYSKIREHVLDVTGSTSSSNSGDVSPN